MKYRTVLLLLIFVFSAYIEADAQKTQDGGVNSIFSMVGARQMGLGGAVVAFPKDPTTIFWNPAGMEYLSRKSFTLFYSSLLEGTTYNFVGYVHPTLSLGTFGVGISRIATGDIIRRDNNPNPLGTFSYDNNELYLSYAKIIRNLVSVGMNVKFERQVMDDLSDVGFGADFSLFYLPQSENFLLKNLQLGLTIQNIYSPRLNPGDKTDFIPHRILFGFARSFSLGDETSPLVWLLSLDKSDQRSLKIQTGLEYSYQNKGMIRFGLNNEQVNFGAGAVYQQFQIDYAFSKLADGEFGNSHKISFIVHFGKTKEEQLELANEKRKREIEQQVSLEQQRERRETISRLLQEGKDLYSSGNYEDARIKYIQVLELDQNNPEAEEMLSETTTRINEIRDQEMREQLARIQEERERKQTEDFVNDHVKKGQDYIARKNYNAAIDEFKAALGALPNNQAIQGMIEDAKMGLAEQVNKLIKQADDLAKKGEYGEAIQILNEAQILSKNDEEKYNEITNRINQLENQLNVYDYYTQGLISYKAEEWQNAMNSFEKALKLDPNNKEIANFYQEAKRRALAREEPITEEIQDRFNRALNLYFEGKIQEAIDIWEELLQIQPYNKIIIDYIDRAKKQLEKQKKAKK